MKNLLRKFTSIKVLFLITIVMYFHIGKITEIGLVSLVGILMGYREYGKRLWVTESKGE